MALGSNSLGLLFKIGVDAKDAEAVFRELMATNKEFAAGVEAGMKAELQAATKASEGLDKVAASSKATTAQINQLRAGFEAVVRGDVLSGLGQIARAVGPAVVGVGALAIGILAATKAIEGMISAANEIGTDSKEDFDKLNESVKAAGGSLTEADHAISQGLNKSLDTLHGAVTDLFAQLLQTSGPALKNLILDIAGLIEDLKPAIRSIAVEIRNDLASLSAFINVIRIMKGILEQDLLTGALVLDTGIIATLYEKAFDQALKAADEVGKSTFKTATQQVKAAKDITQAQLEQNEAARELALQREKAAAQEAEINRELKAGAITAEEALGRRLAIQQTLTIFETAFLDAEQKRIEAEVQGEKRRTDALEANANARQLLAEKEAATQAALADQANKDQIKQDEDRLKRLDKVLEKEQAIGDAILKNQARAAQEVPGGGGIGGIPGAPPEIPLPKPVGGFFDDLQKSLLQSIDTFGTWGDLVGKVLGKFAQATEQAFASFILTGKLSGQIFKQLVAQIIASVAIEAAVKAIFELAEGLADLANLNFYGASMHFAAAKTYGVVAAVAGAVGIGIGLAGGLGGGDATGAAAGGGGFGGASSQAPGTLTINQGAGGGQLGVLLSIDNHLSNITTAPPGDILQRGASQNPMAVGEANNEAARRNGSISREFLQISGLRTA